MRPDFGTPRERPLTARGRVQADGTAWRVACSFGHALSGESIPGAETSKSGRTGIRASADLRGKAAEALSETGVEPVVEAPAILPMAGDPFHTAILSLESLRLSAVGREDEFVLPLLDGGIAAFDASQSAASGKRTRGEPAEPAKALPVVIWSSPAKRCLESAKPLGDLLNTPVRPVESLYEDKEFDLMVDVLSTLPKDCQRLVLVTHLPQIETTLYRLGLSRLGPIQPASALRLLFDNAGRLVASRRI